MTTRKRADVLLVERGLFDSRTRAQAAIAAGRVTADGVVLRKASDSIAPDARLEASDHPWVSRGALKLVAALDHFGFDPGGRVCRARRLRRRRHLARLPLTSSGRTQG